MEVVWGRISDGASDGLSGAHRSFFLEAVFFISREQLFESFAEARVGC